MANRQVILDTETTGLRVEDNHRIIEIGCIELIDRKLTNNHLQFYINPEREIDAGAVAIHGITNEFLKDKPTFIQIVKDFMAFIEGAELIIHNAPFDLAFLNHELSLTRQNWKPINHYCNVIDTLALARQLHVGQRNSLDALCKRYGVDNTKRELHGALLDSHLLAHVYLAMTGGQGSFFDNMSVAQQSTKAAETATNDFTQTYIIPIINATMEELEAHKEYLQLLNKQGKCVWQDS